MISFAAYLLINSKLAEILQIAIKCNFHIHFHSVSIGNSQLGSLSLSTRLLQVYTNFITFNWKEQKIVENSSNKTFLIIYLSQLDSATKLTHFHF